MGTWWSGGSGSGRGHRRCPWRQPPDSRRRCRPTAVGRCGRRAAGAARRVNTGHRRSTTGPIPTAGRSASTRGQDAVELTAHDTTGWEGVRQVPSSTTCTSRRRSRASNSLQRRKARPTAPSHARHIRPDLIHRPCRPGGSVSIPEVGPSQVDDPTRALCESCCSGDLSAPRSMDHAQLRLVDSGLGLAWRRGGADPGVGCPTGSATASQTIG